VKNTITGRNVVDYSFPKCDVLFLQILQDVDMSRPNPLSNTKPPWNIRLARAGQRFHDRPFGNGKLCC